MSEQRKTYDSFIFTHIPKCGGTSFRKYINDAALANDIDKALIYIPGFNDLDNDKNISQLSKDKIAILRKQPLKVLANHSHHGIQDKERLDIKNPFSYTILREPIARFISHYNFFYYTLGYEGCKGISLNDLPQSKLEDLIFKISNIQTKYISGVKHPKAAGWDNVLKIAKYNLLFEFGCFGILEHIDLSVLMLQNEAPEWLQFNDVFPVRNKNNTSKKALSIDDNIIKLIQKINKYDCQLYDFALEQFKTKIEKKNYQIDLTKKNEEPKPITYIQVFGERNSGTNFLKKLIESNFENVEVGFKYGWKHGFVNLRRIQREDTEQTLFLCLFKDPYSWLVSMNNKPHHAPQLFFLEFSDFIKREWVCYKGKGYTERAKQLDKFPVTDEEEMLQERHPKTKERFENVMQLRNLKNDYYIRLKNCCEHYKAIKYEDLLEDSSSILNDIESTYQLKRKSEVIIDQGYHGKNPKKKFNRKAFYLEKKYLDTYSDTDLKYVNKYLDFEIEKTIGYKKIKNL